MGISKQWPHSPLQYQRDTLTRSKKTCKLTELCSAVFSDCVLGRLVTQSSKTGPAPLMIRFRTDVTKSPKTHTSVLIKVFPAQYTVCNISEAAALLPYDKGESEEGYFIPWPPNLTFMLSHNFLIHVIFWSQSCEVYRLVLKVVPKRDWPTQIRHLVFLNLKNV